MPSVTITLTDTPTGSVSIHTDYKPAIGKLCTPAQAAAMDVIARTRKSYGLAPLPIVEVDIDAVHRSRDQVVQS